MINKKKVIKLDNDEELNIITSKNTVLSIKNDNGVLKVVETKSTNLKVNTEIINMDYDELKRFSLFESYYQNTIGSDLDKELEDKINKTMDHHMNVIYGKNNSNMEIVDTEYQCIIYYE